MKEIYGTTLSRAETVYVFQVTQNEEKCIVSEMFTDFNSQIMLVTNFTLIWILCKYWSVKILKALCSLKTQRK